MDIDLKNTTSCVLEIVKFLCSTHLDILDIGLGLDFSYEEVSPLLYTEGSRYQLIFKLYSKAVDKYPRWKLDKILTKAVKWWKIIPGFYRFCKKNKIHTLEFTDPETVDLPLKLSDSQYFARVTLLLANSWSWKSDLVSTLHVFLAGNTWKVLSFIGSQEERHTQLYNILKVGSNRLSTEKYWYLLNLAFVDCKLQEEYHAFAEKYKLPEPVQFGAEGLHENRTVEAE